jgi:hypothetical protein
VEEEALLLLMAWLSRRREMKNFLHYLMYDVLGKGERDGNSVVAIVAFFMYSFLFFSHILLLRTTRQLPFPFLVGLLEAK